MKKFYLFSLLINIDLFALKKTYKKFNYYHFSAMLILLLCSLHAVITVISYFDSSQTSGYRDCVIDLYLLFVKSKK